MNRSILIFGADGQLAKQFQKELTARQITHWVLNKYQCDITHYDAIQKVIDLYAPEVVVNCAAYNLVDEAETRKEHAFQINCTSVKNIAQACRKNNVALVHFSSDYVFDGEKGDYYNENDVTNPLNVYGISKLRGEMEIKTTMSNYLILRTSWVYGDGPQNFIRKILDWSSKSDVLNISNDEVSVPTSAVDIVNITLELLTKNIYGLFHVTNSGCCSRFDWCRSVIDILKMNTKIFPVSKEFFKMAAKRPAFSPLNNAVVSKHLDFKIPHWQESLRSYLLANHSC